jgi:GPI-anchor transamidase subunit U
MVQVASFWLLRVLFRPPGTLYSLNVGLCFLLTNPRSLARIHQISSLFAVCAIPIPVILYMVGYWMWLEPGNGEANYVFFQCLAYNIFVAILFLNFCSASLRRDKALRLTEKSIATRADSSRKRQS